MGGNRNHLRVIEGRPWKQALICALNPEAPYQPWIGIGEVAHGDAVVVVIDTDPRTVLCAFTRGHMLDVRHTIMAESRFEKRALPTVAEVERALGFSLADRVGRLLQNDAAEALIRAVNDFRSRGPAERVGDSSVAIGRILLASEAECTCCGEEVDLDREGVVDRLIHTASAEDLRMGVDWPGLLCEVCAALMTDGGFTSMADLVFSQHPACPACSAQRTRCVSYRMPSYDWRINMAPWEISGGCVVDLFPMKWSCAQCGHRWS